MTAWTLVLCLLLILVSNIRAKDSPYLWTEVSHNITEISCPHSPFSYDCKDVNQRVWSAPSLAYSPHSMASYKPQDPLCFVFLPGTGGTAADSLMGLLTSVAHLGIHVLGLSYMSSPFPVMRMNTLCGDMTRNGGLSVAACMEAFFSTVVFGSADGGPSAIWNVTEAQSVQFRLVNTLSQLHQKFPESGWGNFLTSTDNPSVQWDRIAIAGHSQGSGHAAYIAYALKTARAILLSGSGACCSENSFFLRSSYEWQTSANDISALYHLYDDERGSMQVNLEAMGLPAPTEYISDATIDASMPTDGVSRQSGRLVQSLQTVSHTRSGSVFYTRIPAQADCVCTDRMEHCSISVDTCSPLHGSRYTEYAYEHLWQFLVLGRYVDQDEENTDASFKKSLLSIIGVACLVGGLIALLHVLRTRENVWHQSRGGSSGRDEGRLQAI